MDSSIPPPSAIQWDSMIDGMRHMLASITELVPAGQLSPQQITKLINDLPRIKENQLIELGQKDSSCPICINPYLTILTEEEMAHAMDSPAHPIEELGVTKLNQPWQCGHIFCRRDISKWILEGHDSCPMCRQRLVEPSQDELEQPADRSSSSSSPEADQPRADRPNEEYSSSNNINIEDLRRHFAGGNMPLGGDMFDRLLRDLGRVQSGLAGTHPQEEDDRQEFSGMYS
ncbi:hypothetical protein CVT25_003934 [Psilocybe cyanescens]|uniref:RING-type domain-containing protein n=1 Tax=Psilocybe cyanescens TaxID=93625 RepID=A0A409XW39_PSICY|nr:hypothetical protein CVT25_003934 [Psilocybe cyanescens]